MLGDGGGGVGVGFLGHGGRVVVARVCGGLCARGLAPSSFLEGDGDGVLEGEGGVVADAHPGHESLFVPVPGYAGDTGPERGLDVADPRPGADG